MTPAARLQAAIEVLEQIAARRAPADELVRAWGKAHRFAGSGDRRAITERVYAVLRARARLAWRMQDDAPRALVLAALTELDGLAPDAIAALFSGERYAPAPLREDEQARLAASPPPAPEWVEAGLPAFLADAFKARFGDAWMAEAQGLMGGRAPLDLRVNTLRGDREGAAALLRTDGVSPLPTPLSALGLRVGPELAPDVQRLRAFTSGWVEVQDEASQVAAALAGARPGQVVVDYCAGGGGKTLALAAAMGLRASPDLARAPDPLARAGRLVAMDVSARRLAAMAPRLARADALAEVRVVGRGESDKGPVGAGRGDAGWGDEDLLGAADLVFVDAPCSGSGTWRRHPEAAWRLTAEGVGRLAVIQSTILQRASALVRPGGRLVYATCSVLAQENEAVVEAFAAAHPAFRPRPVASAAQTPALSDAARARLAALAGDGHTLTMTPARTGTDGFFVALFERHPAERHP